MEQCGILVAELLYIVIMLFGIHGGLRQKELLNFKWNLIIFVIDGGISVNYAGLADVV